MAAFVNDSVTTPVPLSILHKQQELRAVVGVTCSLSMAGSLLIILSYILFRDLRTNARLILLHLSLADFGVAFSNLFGACYQFDRFFHFNSTVLSPPSVRRLCTAQAFLAHFSTISSVLWTMMLAAYMYTVVVKFSSSGVAAKKNQWFMRFSYVFCYGITLFINVWMLCTQKLGFSPFSTSGWCGTILHRVNSGAREVNYLIAIFGYDLWIVLTTVVIIVIYFSLHFHVRRERSQSSDFRELMHNIDYKFIVIPVAFVLLRLGSLLQNCVYIYGHALEKKHELLTVILEYMSGIGDSGQGAVNAVIFVMFTRNVRQKIFACCYWCFLKRSLLKIRLIGAPGGSEFSTDDSRALNKSNPVHIAPKTSQTKNRNMGSMASTTTMSPSPSRYSDNSLSDCEP